MVSGVMAGYGWITGDGWTVSPAFFMSFFEGGPTGIFALDK